MDLCIADLCARLFLFNLLASSSYFSHWSFGTRPAIKCFSYNFVVDSWTQYTFSYVSLNRAHLNLSQHSVMSILWCIFFPLKICRSFGQEPSLASKVSPHFCATTAIELGKPCTNRLHNDECMKIFPGPGDCDKGKCLCGFCWRRMA